MAQPTKQQGRLWIVKVFARAKTLTRQQGETGPSVKINAKEKQQTKMSNTRFRSIVCQPALRHYQDKGYAQPQATKGCATDQMSLLIFSGRE
ncbi:hypothetical protein [Amphritea sp. HPY]|uniref:hypothetical protein n=1 Tax=Amphritea sp. HPY TaxID=3421652 RepID=UPI003D7D0074